MFRISETNAPWQSSKPDDVDAQGIALCEMISNVLIRINTWFQISAAYTPEEFFPQSRNLFTNHFWVAQNRNSQFSHRFEWWNATEFQKYCASEDKSWNYVIQTTEFTDLMALWQKGAFRYDCWLHYSQTFQGF